MAWRSMDPAAARWYEAMRKQQNAMEMATIEAKAQVRAQAAGVDHVTVEDLEAAWAQIQIEREIDDLLVTGW